MATERTHENSSKDVQLTIAEGGNEERLFKVNAEHCQEDTPSTLTQPASAKLDWRKYKANKKHELLVKTGCHLNPSTLELIQAGEMIEHSTIKAALLELECRFPDLKDRATLVPPSVVVALAEPAGLILDRGGEVMKAVNEIKSSELVLFAVWAQGPPRHYTYLELFRKPGTEQREVVYKDSLRGGTAANKTQAQQVLKNLEMREAADNLEISNKNYFQDDGWSCGAFVTEWFEVRLRKLRGEPRLPSPGLMQGVARTAPSKTFRNHMFS